MLWKSLGLAGSVWKDRGALFEILNRAVRVGSIEKVPCELKFPRGGAVNLVAIWVKSEETVRDA